ncbi:ParB N-terminal domain-containing protein [Planctomicrobium sp. SH661]|uniref:ParB N-terminal domain-containing protein n=1 Tax=Planctomicrobium sp. SH661 TaxID=3448124 RepID=UPI003F5B620A
MLLKKLPISELNPAPYNPRVELKPGSPVWKKLQRSLDEFDLVQPIVWNQRTGHVVSGHQRLALLKHRGDEEVDCVIVDLPLAKEKALNVTLNNAAVASDWDADKLIELVAELQDLPDFDATLTGFDAQQLHDLILAPDPEVDQEESSQQASSDKIQATLEVEPTDWEGVQTQLDSLLATFPQVRLHVRGTPS